jgi:hypothetical protein
MLLLPDPTLHVIRFRWYSSPWLASVLLRRLPHVAMASLRLVPRTSSALTHSLLGQSCVRFEERASICVRVYGPNFQQSPCRGSSECRVAPGAAASRKGVDVVYRALWRTLPSLRTGVGLQRLALHTTLRSAGP